MTARVMRARARQTTHRPITLKRLAHQAIGPQQDLDAAQTEVLCALAEALAGQPTGVTRRDLVDCAPALGADELEGALGALIDRQLISRRCLTLHLTTAGRGVAQSI
jgi:hypothetical protein